tara:strand:+ start:55843 stop:56085 length:243 start_codon:yes stop_codon:yes gene_type:complete
MRIDVQDFLNESDYLNDTTKNAPLPKQTNTAYYDSVKIDLKSKTWWGCFTFTVLYTDIPSYTIDQIKAYERERIIDDLLD